MRSGRAAPGRPSIAPSGTPATERGLPANVSKPVYAKPVTTTQTDERRCPSCLQTKPLDAFYDCGRVCRACARSAVELLTLAVWGDEEPPPPRPVPEWDARDRTCSSCERTKPTAEFPERGSLGYVDLDRYFTCLACRRLAPRLRQYGITAVEFYRLYEEQEHACGSCRKPAPVPEELHIDHCHDTDVVRGLLCAMCNQGIGMLGDTLEAVERAAAYLRSHAERVARNETLSATHMAVMAQKASAETVGSS